MDAAFGGFVLFEQVECDAVEYGKFCAAWPARWRRFRPTATSVLCWMRYLAMQGRPRPDDRSGPHHRDRGRVLPLPQNPGEEAKSVIPEESPFGSASASPYGLRSSRTEHYPLNHNVPAGGTLQNAKTTWRRACNHHDSGEFSLIARAAQIKLVRNSESSVGAVSFCPRSLL